MSFRPAYDEIVLEHGSNVVILRPSLRAASTLERSHDSFALLARRIDEFHTGTLREIITTAATDRKDAAAFLTAMSREPLRRFVEIAQAPLFRLCAGFIPASDSNATPSSNAKPMPWREVYRELFRTATGWLHWTPEAAWNSTPTEINEAFAGHVAMLKALHGGEDDEPAERQPSPEQAARNVADGLDPEFDRAGLHALKARHQGTRQ
ncbi:hypothetical protein ASG72_02045 [Bosea sp. Leaf344]|uniref:hypothetical protein n=1 Tax=Bosea sp. Leaf344 TaxID=1736346 RepID=UPI0006F23F9A|nr:hypothetical protein [Bosea sp. Leaf344]KQU54444.1 hypothetical protein ASG72_02045 [Bosea sp. Leaf344]